MHCECAHRAALRASEPRTAAAPLPEARTSSAQPVKPKDKRTPHGRWKELDHDLKRIRPKPFLVYFRIKTGTLIKKQSNPHSYKEHQLKKSFFQLGAAPVARLRGCTGEHRENGPAGIPSGRSPPPGSAQRLHAAPRWRTPPPRTRCPSAARGADSVRQARLPRPLLYPASRSTPAPPGAPRAPPGRASP